MERSLQSLIQRMFLEIQFYSKDDVWFNLSLANLFSLPSNIWTILECQSDIQVVGHLFKYREFSRHKLDRQSRAETKPNLRRTVCTAAYTACYIDSGPHRAEMPKSSSGGRRRRERERGGESRSKNGQNKTRKPERRTSNKRSRFLDALASLDFTHVSE